MVQRRPTGNAGDKMGFQITGQQPVDLLSQYALYYTITINNLHSSQRILSTVMYNSNQWGIKVKSLGHKGEISELWSRNWISMWIPTLIYTLKSRPHSFRILNIRISTVSQTPQMRILRLEGGVDSLPNTLLPKQKYGSHTREPPGPHCPLSAIYLPSQWLLRKDRYDEPWSVPHTEKFAAAYANSFSLNFLNHAGKTSQTLFDLLCLPYQFRIHLQLILYSKLPKLSGLPTKCCLWA